MIELNSKRSDIPLLNVGTKVVFYLSLVEENGRQTGEALYDLLKEDS